MSYVTAGGKEVAVRPASNSRMYEIYFTTGGELPSVFTGQFTSIPAANKVIESYLNVDKSSNGTRKGKQGV